MQGLAGEQYKIFAASECKAFVKVPTVERVFIPPITEEEIVDALMRGRFWESIDEAYGVSTVSGRADAGDGIVQFLREVKTQLGPMTVRLKLWTTQWVDEKASMPVVISHAYDELGKCHLVSNFVLKPEPDGLSVRVCYEELTSSPALAVRLGASKIKKAHEAALESLAKTLLLAPKASAQSEQEETVEMELPQLLTASSMLDWDMCEMTVVKPVVAQRKPVSNSELNSSLKRIELYKSQMRRLKRQEQKHAAGSTVLALNAELDQWERARVLNFQDGLYEVEFESGEMQCCDDVEIQAIAKSSPRSFRAPAEPKAETSPRSSGGRTIVFSRSSDKKIDLAKSSPYAAPAAALVPVPISRNAPGSVSPQPSRVGRVSGAAAAAPVGSNAKRIVMVKQPEPDSESDDDLLPPTEEAPTPRQVTWQISAIEDVGCLFNGDDEYQ